MGKKIEENEIINFLSDTKELLVSERMNEAAGAITSNIASNNLVNDVNLWRHIGNNTQEIQGFGFEFDVANHERSKLRNLFKLVKLNKGSTRQGDDVLVKSLFRTKEIEVKSTATSRNINYNDIPNKSILNTSKDIHYQASNKHPKVQSHMTNKQIKSTAQKRRHMLESNKANTNLTTSNMLKTAGKAGLISFAITMSIETIALHKKWKNNELSTEEYLKGVLNSGAASGVSSTVSSALMVPVVFTAATLGISTLLTIPLAFVMTKKVNHAVLPLFKKGEYQSFLSRFTYYESFVEAVDDYYRVGLNNTLAYVDYIRDTLDQRARFSILHDENERARFELEQKMMGKGESNESGN